VIEGGVILHPLRTVRAIVRQRMFKGRIVLWLMRWRPFSRSVLNIGHRGRKRAKRLELMRFLFSNLRSPLG
jgi:hypothetical protein